MNLLKENFNIYYNDDGEFNESNNNDKNSQMSEKIFQNKKLHKTGSSNDSTFIVVQNVLDYVTDDLCFPEISILGNFTTLQKAKEKIMSEINILLEKDEDIDPYSYDDFEDDPTNNTCVLDFKDDDSTKDIFYNIFEVSKGQKFDAFMAFSNAHQDAYLVHTDIFGDDISELKDKNAVLKRFRDLSCDDSFYELEKDEDTLTVVFNVAYTSTPCEIHAIVEIPEAK